MHSIHARNDPVLGDLRPSIPRLTKVAPEHRIFRARPTDDVNALPHAEERDNGPTEVNQPGIRGACAGREPRAARRGEHENPAAVDKNEAEVHGVADEPVGPVGDEGLVLADLEVEEVVLADLGVRARAEEAAGDEHARAG